MLGGVWVTYQGLVPKRILAGPAPPITSACPNPATAPGAGCKAKARMGKAFPCKEGFTR